MNESTPPQDDPTPTPQEEAAPASSKDSAVASAKEALDPILQKRLIAGIIDVVIGLVLASVIAMILPKLSMIGYALQLGYWLTKDALPFLDGKSVGKKVMGLRAVTTEGKPLTGNWKASAIRNVFLYIALIEAIVLFLRKDDPAKKGLRLGDDFANTKVILSQD